METVEVAPQRRADPVAKGRVCNARLDAPGATAQHPPFTLASRPNDAIARCSRVVVVPAIAHPFPDIPDHVVQTEDVGGVPSLWLGLQRFVLLAPGFLLRQIVELALACFGQRDISALAMACASARAFCKPGMVR